MELAGGGPLGGVVLSGATSIFEGSFPLRDTRIVSPARRNVPMNEWSISAFVRNSESLSQSDPRRKCTISTRLLFPALFRVCLPVDPGCVSAKRTFNPLWNRTLLNVVIVLSIEMIIARIQH